MKNEYLHHSTIVSFTSVFFFWIYTIALIDAERDIAPKNV